MNGFGTILPPLYFSSNFQGKFISYLQRVANGDNPNNHKIQASVNNNVINIPNKINYINIDSLQLEKSASNLINGNIFTLLFLIVKQYQVVQIMAFKLLILYSKTQDDLV